MVQALFPEFARLWVIVCTTRELAAGAPKALIVAGERVVLFRDTAGAARALIDRCPHRGVALSLGKVRDGQIECPFHGWRFDGAGQCRHVPWNPEAKLERLGATALPVREADGLVWLFTGTEAEGEPRVPEVLQRPGLRLTAQHFDWAAHWTRVMENMLDTPHLPFVHAGTIGRQLRGRTDRAMALRWRETDHGAEILAQREGEAERVNLRYHFPNVMELAIDPPGKVLRMLAVCLPAEAGRTRLSIYTLRSFARWRWLDPLFDHANRKIAREDQAILESSLPAEVPPAGEEKSVATDAPTLAFRKLWFSAIRGR